MVNALPTRPPASGQELFGFPYDPYDPLMIRPMIPPMVRPYDPLQNVGKVNVLSKRKGLELEILF